MKYTIRAVGPDVKTINGKFGPANVYKLKFNETDEVIEMIRATKNGAPHVGEILEGTITNGDYGPYFKPDPKSRGGGFGSKPSAADSSVTMYVSYVKDLAINYLNFIDWEADKFDQAKFNKIVKAVGEASQVLKDASEKPKQEETITTQDVVDSWGDEKLEIPEGF